MDTTRLCPQCQQPLSADAPDGLCPQCLLMAASGPPPSAAGVGLPGDIIDIGDPAEVAKKLPQFEILELLGRGGMGVVYKARQLQLDRIVALKILPPVDALSVDFVARFTREARALAKLNHPNIVSVYDFGETGGLYYIVMEYVDGANLRQLFEARKLTPAEALAIVPKICDALEYAHEEGLVHRDIKPENLLIDKKGRVKIADFGLAKLLRREPLDMTLTLSGMALGTLRYMAPEQMDKPETVDHRADLYSLGVVIYEMLTGETPVGRFELPSQKAQVDVRFDEIVLHALEREPTRRYQHASEVREDVEKVTGKPHSAGTGNAAGVSAEERRGEWLIQCTDCGHAKPLAAAGGIRIGGASVGKRFPISCSQCGGGMGTLVRTRGVASPADAGPPVEPRLSRRALWGAICVALGLVANLVIFVLISNVAFYLGLVRDGEPSIPAWSRLIIMACLPFGVALPVAGTILSWRALRDLSEKPDRIAGRGLAFAAALAFPLIVVDVSATAALDGLASFLGGLMHWDYHTKEGLWILLSVAACLSLDIGLVAKVWRHQATRATRERGETVTPSASESPADPEPTRHLLSAGLVLLFFSALIFGMNFRASSSATAAGRTSNVYVGTVDPWFVYERSPDGFYQHIQVFSWSLFAVVVSGIAFGALWRIGREDEGKVPRDPAWWRDWWKQVGIWGGLLLIACIVRTVRHPEQVLQRPGDRTASSSFTKLFSAGPEFREDPSRIPATRTPGRTDYAHAFSVPANHRLFVWLEWWKDGKRTIDRNCNTGYVAKPGQRYDAGVQLVFTDGNVTGLATAGQTRIDWIFYDPTGHADSGHWQPDFFAGMMTTTSWGKRSSWSPKPGETVTLLAIAGGKDSVLSSPITDDGLRAGHWQAAMLLKARVEAVPEGRMSTAPVTKMNAWNDNEDPSPALLRLGEQFGADLGPFATAANHREQIASRIRKDADSRARAEQSLRENGVAFSPNEKPEELVKKLEGPGAEKPASK